MFLELEDLDLDIIIYINSFGGFVILGFVIYDIMNYVRCDVLIICIGMVVSMSVFLFVGGIYGKRCVLFNLEIMIY